jgi:hypothetical protein
MYVDGNRATQAQFSFVSGFGATLHSEFGNAGAVSMTIRPMLFGLIFVGGLAAVVMTIPIIRATPPDAVALGVSPIASLRQ